MKLVQSKTSWKSLFLFNSSQLYSEPGKQNAFRKADGSKSYYLPILKLLPSNYGRKAWRTLKNKQMLGFQYKVSLEIKLHWELLSLHPWARSLAISTFQCHRTHQVSDNPAGLVQHIAMASSDSCRGQCKDNTDLPGLTRWEIENYLLYHYRTRRVNQRVDLWDKVKAMISYKTDLL